MDNLDHSNRNHPGSAHPINERGQSGHNQWTIDVVWRNPNKALALEIR
jgi:hypothetical protein